MNVIVHTSRDDACLYCHTSSPQGDTDAAVRREHEALLAEIPWRF